jgi:hypothetical protein
MWPIEQPYIELGVNRSAWFVVGCFVAVSREGLCLQYVKTTATYLTSEVI